MVQRGQRGHLRSADGYVRVLNVTLGLEKMIQSPSVFDIGIQRSASGFDVGVRKNSVQNCNCLYS